jgi:hypothetical protein
MVARHESADQASSTFIVLGGPKGCPPIRQGPFETEKEALDWLHKHHCKGDCRDNGGMVMGGDGDYEAIRFCIPKRWL